jgi:hypothetical protein
MKTFSHDWFISRRVLDYVAFEVGDVAYGQFILEKHCVLFPF